MDQKSPKKLVLNRETVRELTREDMEQVDGGFRPFTKYHDCISVSGDPCQYYC